MAQRSDFLIAVLDVCHFRALSLKSSFDVFNLRDRRIGGAQIHTEDARAGLKAGGGRAKFFE